MIKKGCTLCPRACGADRGQGRTGYCGMTDRMRAARAALHFWEEPCISGKNGSGAIFFSGCTLRCVYCQNREISTGKKGVELSVARLVEIFFELEEQGAANINLVTPDHFAASIKEAISLAKRQGFSLPFIFNCSGYETVETLQSLEGLIDVYLTDFKYMKEESAARYSRAADYPQVVKAALAEMVRQQPQLLFGEDGMLKRGVVVRHLLLPLHRKEAERIVEYVHRLYGEKVYISLLSQYTPVEGLDAYPEINRRVTKREYERLLDFALSLGVAHCFVQGRDSADEGYIPFFCGEGVDIKRGI